MSRPLRTSLALTSMLFGAVSSAACKSDYADLTGDWRSDWGRVSITENMGTYTDTYGPGPGTLEFTLTGDRTYSCRWGESEKRHGTMTVTLSEDGKKLTGSWTPDSDVKIGGKTGGRISWTKK